MKNKAKKNRVFNNNRKVRQNISLNKTTDSTGTYFMLANDEWTENLLEQIRELYPEAAFMNYISNTR